MDLENLERISLADDVRISGAKPKIQLNERMFTIIEELINRPGDNTNQILSARFNIAKTILHELVHAFAFATDPEAYRLGSCLSKKHIAEAEIRLMEPMYEDEGKPEVGCSYESSVLGGVTIWDMHLDSATLLKEWPSVGPQGTYFRGPEKTVKTYIVPMTFIHKIHQQSFVSCLLC